MDISVYEAEEEEGKECFDDKVLDLRLKRKRKESLEQTKGRKFTVGYHHGRLNV